MHGKVTWVLVADGQRATVYYNDGPGKGLQVVPELSEQRIGHSTHEMMTDKPGRMKASSGATGSSGMTPRSDPHEAEEQKFVEHLAGELNLAAIAKRFDRLILAAPPRALGYLRGALSAATTKLVLAELHKDLTKNSTADLVKHLEPHMAV